MWSSWVWDEPEKSYKNFVVQIDTLTDAEVRWTPYSQECVDSRTP
jgi:hypothetical protein